MEQKRLAPLESVASAEELVRYKLERLRDELAVGETQAAQGAFSYATFEDIMREAKLKHEQGVRVKHFCNLKRF